MIGVDSGWEIYVAGNGGIKTEVAQFLVKVKTAAEVLEYAGAFLQLYREEGWYLERTVHFVSRVGLDYVRKKVLDDADGRRALWERLQFALEGEPDPWHEPARAGVDAAAVRSRSCPCRPHEPDRCRRGSVDRVRRPMDGCRVPRCAADRIRPSAR